MSPPLLSPQDFEDHVDPAIWDFLQNQKYSSIHKVLLPQLLLPPGNSPASTSGPPCLYLWPPLLLPLAPPAATSGPPAATSGPPCLYLWPPLPLPLAPLAAISCPSCRNCWPPSPRAPPLPLLLRLLAPPPTCSATAR